MSYLEPTVSKSLRDQLSDAVSSASKADRALAAYMLAEFGNLPFETAASLAIKVGVSEPTVGRFAAPSATMGLRISRKICATIWAISLG